LRRLKASGAEISRGRAIDRGPARPEAADPVSVRRWMAAVGAAADDLVALARADRGADEWIAEFRAVRSRGEATSRSALAVSGDDLVAAGIVVPGPALGRLLARLLASVIEDPGRNTREGLLALARDTSP
jgi:hypothetical protein